MIRSPLLERVVLPLSERLSRAKFWSACRAFARADAAPPAAIAETQQARLRSLVDGARSSTRFWGERLALVAPDSIQLGDLAGIAPVGKSELEAGFPDDVTSSRVPQSEWRFAATRGTTQRMICVHDFAKRDAMRAAIMHTLRVSGYRLGMRIVEIPPDICDVVCGDQGERDEGVARHFFQMLRQKQWRDPKAYRDLRGLVERNWVFNRKTYPPFGPGGSHPGDARLDYYVSRLQHDKPFLLKGLTTYLYQIAKRVLSRGDVRLSIPVIKPLGSGAAPHVRAVLERAFGGAFWDDYGSAELGAVAYACGRSEGMHVFEELFIVEVLDRHGLPAQPGELGELVITDLVNQAMPLIRYRLGDLGRLIDGACACGRTSRRLSVEGRVHDALRDAHGGWVSSHEVAEQLYRLPWLDQFQLVEKRPDLLELTVVPAQGREPDAAEIEAMLAARLGRPLTVRLRTARAISPEPGGKFRLVKALPLKAAGAAVPVNG